VFIVRAKGFPGWALPIAGGVMFLNLLESVRKDHAGLQSFLSMRRIEASLRNASAL
jgi:hypothetical protein